MPGDIDFADAGAHPDRRLRHRLYRRPDRQVPDRAAGRPAGRRRDRLGVPLPRAGRCGRAPWPSPCRSRARPPTPWRPCAAARPTGMKSAAVVNAHESTMAREVDVVWPIHCGPEIGVASTKAFTAQVAVLTALAVAAAAPRGKIDAAEEQRLVQHPAGGPAPDRRGHRPARTPSRRSPATSPRHRDVLYLGRGPMYAAGPGRRAEAEGNQLHPRRGLRRRRAEARPHRPGRRPDPDHHPGPLRQLFREVGLEHERGHGARRPGGVHHRPRRRQARPGRRPGGGAPPRPATRWSRPWSCRPRSSFWPTTWPW